MILPQDGEPFPATPSQDRLLRYVPLQKASAISFAFDSGRLVAIASHGRSSQHIDFYDEADSDTLCLHCPLSEIERIEAIWAVRPKNKVLKLGTCSVIVSTTTLEKHRTHGRAGENSNEDHLVGQLLVS